MPERYTHWRCSSCRQSYFTYENARACEIDHQLKEAADRVSEAIKAVFSGVKYPAHRRDPS